MNECVREYIYERMCINKSVYVYICELMCVLAFIKIHKPKI